MIFTVNYNFNEAKSAQLLLAPLCLNYREEHKARVLRVSQHYFVSSINRVPSPSDVNEIGSHLYAPLHVSYTVGNHPIFEQFLMVQQMQFFAWDRR